MVPHLDVDPDAVDLDGLADALQDQESYDHWWVLDPRTGQVDPRSRDLEEEDENGEVEAEAVVVQIEPYPSRVWYHDMVDFAEGLTDERATRRLLRALDGRGAFRRFRNELYEEYPELVSVWQAFRTARARRRAVEWLLDEELIDEATAERLSRAHLDRRSPDP